MRLKELSELIFVTNWSFVEVNHCWKDLSSVWRGHMPRYFIHLSIQLNFHSHRQNGLLFSHFFRCGTTTTAIKETKNSFHFHDNFYSFLFPVDMETRDFILYFHFIHANSLNFFACKHYWRVDGGEGMRSEREIKNSYFGLTDFFFFALFILKRVCHRLPYGGIVDIDFSSTHMCECVFIYLLITTDKNERDKAKHYSIYLRKLMVGQSTVKTGINNKRNKRENNFIFLCALGKEKFVVFHEVLQALTPISFPLTLKFNACYQKAANVCECYRDFSFDKSFYGFLRLSRNIIKFLFFFERKVEIILWGRETFFSAEKY